MAGTPAQQTCSRCERAHGLCRRSSKLGFLLVASRLRRTSVGRKLETKLSGSAELGFADGVWGWTGLGAFGRRQAKKNATATPGRPQQPHTAHLLSLDFREMLHNNPPTRPETMLRTFTAQPGKASATLLSHTTGAANLISMVFQIRQPKPPGAGAPAKGKPCLAFLLPT